MFFFCLFSLFFFFFFVCAEKSLAMEWQEYRCRRVDNEGIVDFCRKVYKRCTPYRNRILAYNDRWIRRICIKLNVISLVVFLRKYWFAKKNRDLMTRYFASFRISYLCLVCIINMSEISKIPLDKQESSVSVTGEERWKNIENIILFTKMITLISMNALFSIFLVFLFHKKW